MLARVVNDEIVVASPDGEPYFSFTPSSFADISYVCGDTASKSIVVTAAKQQADVADVRANQRGRYRAYRVSSVGTTALSNEYTNTATPLLDGSIAYSNGSNLVVRSGSERRAWKTGNFNWGPVSISCNDDASMIAMTKWKGDDRKLFLVDLQSGVATTSSFSYYSYVMKGRSVYYSLGSSVKRFTPASNDTANLTGKSFSKALLAIFGVSDAPATVQTHFSFLTLLGGRLLAAVRQYNIVVPDLVKYGDAVVSWTAGQTDIRVEHLQAKDEKIVELISDGESAIVTSQIAMGSRPSVTRKCGLGPRAPLIAAGWDFIGVSTIPSHGFQFLPTKTEVT